VCDVYAPTSFVVSLGEWEACMEWCEDEAAAWQEEEEAFARDPNCRFSFRVWKNREIGY
jgi:hypothetical protein